MLLGHDTSVSSRLSLNSPNRLKLGIFGSNLSSGKNATLAPERWQATWDNNQRLAQMADDFGLEFFLPIGRWRGFGGVTGYQETGFETVTWATGLLVATKRITVFCTIHAPLFHPVVAAKMMVTADQAGHGRFGLNIVCGHNEDEFAMFGIPCLPDTERYVHGQEWITIVKRLWTEADDFDFDGRHFQLKAVRSKPKPYGGTQPVILNAARSDTGQAFAVRNADAFFTSVKSSEFDEKTGVVTPAVDAVAENLRKVRAKAAAVGRDIGVYTNVNVICRPTQREAIDYYRYVLEENADWEAVDGQIQAGGTKKDLDSPAYVKRRTSAIRQFPLIGDPDRVAQLFITLSEIGFDGIGLTFVNYLDELPYFRDEVMSRLERAGVRAPAARAAAAVGA
ncbi:MAG TPA: LLM class flavin-dependent oxidoreductase [Candidatus Acidoferrales bacterium]|nr:LLM class flavin-dependent oxidoreductase [Candidatus Acidoferrales bacterium]